MKDNWWQKVENPNQIVTVNWLDGTSSTIWWNEVCASVLEHFGLPGDRFYYTPKMDYMTFTFKTEQDALMCKLLLSEVL